MKNHRTIMAAGAALVLAGVATFGVSTAAYADDVAPVDVPVVETIEETPVETPVVEEEPVIEEDTTSARVSSSSVKLPICHSGSGAHWSYIAPDASGYNGHQNHDNDLYGLTEAECLAKNVVEEPVDVDYTTVAWLAGDAPPNHFDVPQTYLFHEDTEEPSLNTLDDEIEEYLKTLKCGTDADIQVDVYYDNDTTDSLIAGKILYGPSNPDEDLIPGGAGTAWKFVHIEAPDCVTNVVCETFVDGGTSTNLDANGWVSIDTRTSGHAEYVEDALHIFTDDATSQAKVSWAKAVSFPLSGIGQPQLDYDADYGIDPGLNAFVTFAPGISGTLVWEQVYGGADWWLTNGSNAAIVAPQTGGGFGSNRHGTIDEWLALYPDAQVTGIAFSLGSGVYGGGDLHSIGLGCTTDSFDYENIPVVVELGVSGPQAQCGIAGVLPELPELEHIDLSVSPEGTGPGTYTVTATAHAGYVIDGQAVFEIVVPEALEYQNENNEAPCFMEPKEKVVTDGTPKCDDRTYPQTTTVFTLDPVTGLYDDGVSTTVQLPVKEFKACEVLAFTGVITSPFVWIGAGFAMLIGTVLFLIPFGNKRGWFQA